MRDKLRVAQSQVHLGSTSSLQVVNLERKIIRPCSLLKCLQESISFGRLRIRKDLHRGTQNPIRADKDAEGLCTTDRNIQPPSFEKKTQIRGVGLGNGEQADHE